MKRLLLVMGVLGLAAAGSPALADVCNLDPRPAATLLLPYFEVDTTSEKGVDTVFSIGNATILATLTHVTIWSDLSVPVLGFDVYLTGFDMEIVDLGQILRTGVLPRTASAGQDPTDTISNHGPNSQDINFASCNGILPPANLSAADVDSLKRALTGQPAPNLGNLCAGRNLGDGIARGYVTVDQTRACTLLYPSDPGYFGPSGVTGTANRLFGDYSLSHPKRGAASSPLVHIEASDTDPETSTPGQYTFYGRYVGWNADDRREPLATDFAVRYDDGSDLVVWRDSKVSQQAVPCPAGPGNPAWMPLGHELVVLWDLQEESVETPSSAAPFPVETQRVRVGSSSLPGLATRGWAILGLNTTVAAAGANPPEDPAAAQAWVGVIHPDGKPFFMSGYHAMRYDNACQASHITSGLFTPIFFPPGF